MTNIRPSCAEAVPLSASRCWQSGYITFNLYPSHGLFLSVHSQCPHLSIHLFNLNVFIFPFFFLQNLQHTYINCLFLIRYRDMRICVLWDFGGSVSCLLYLLSCSCAPFRLRRLNQLCPFVEILIIRLVFYRRSVYFTNHTAEHSEYRYNRI